MSRILWSPGASAIPAGMHRHPAPRPSMDSWFEVALVATIFAIGNILFARFEAETPKWRRVVKVILMLAVTRAISAELGRPWSYLFIGVLIGFVLIVHAWWLPRNGINGWTGKPKARYYALRGWRLPNSDQPLH